MREFVLTKDWMVQTTTLFSESRFVTKTVITLFYRQLERTSAAEVACAIMKVRAESYLTVA